MSLFDWLLPPPPPPRQEKDGYVKTQIEDVVVGDEIKGQGLVIKKYKHYTMWELGFKGSTYTFITKGEYVWVKK